MKDAAAAEAATEKEYRDNGDVLECQCCFDSYAINKITHCDGDEPHFFCLDCAESNAKNEIGNSRYKLTCMDGSGCKASFSREQKQRFLDAKSFETLERIQQQAELRLAKLPNLSECPFCDFAAICPPVDVDKEFRCGDPKCEKISCRLCKLESHLPLTCEESKRESGISERHVIEEARTEALLRICPKCKVKILKEDGCNKVICTCGGMLCDYCGKDISEVGYVHFDGGTGTGGKKCPTYDNFRVRRNKEVEKAEAKAFEKIHRENPNIDAEDLKIKFAETIKGASQREQRFLEAPPFPPGLEIHHHGYHHHHHVHHHDHHAQAHDVIPGIAPLHHYHHRPRQVLAHQIAQREQEVQAYQHPMGQRVAALHNQLPVDNQIRARRDHQVDQHPFLAREAERALERERFRRYNPIPNAGPIRWPNDNPAAPVPGPFGGERVEHIGLPPPDLHLAEMARNVAELERRLRR